MARKRGIIETLGLDAIAAGFLGLGILGVIALIAVLFLLSIVGFAILSVVLIWALGVLNIASYPMDLEHVGALTAILIALSWIIGGVKASFKN